MITCYTVVPLPATSSSFTLASSSHSNSTNGGQVDATTQSSAMTEYATVEAGSSSSSWSASLTGFIAANRTSTLFTAASTYVTANSTGTTTSSGLTTSSALDVGAGAVTVIGSASGSSTATRDSSILEGLLPVSDTSITATFSTATTATTSVQYVRSTLVGTVPSTTTSSSQQNTVVTSTSSTDFRGGYVTTKISNITHAITDTIAVVSIFEDGSSKNEWAYKFTASTNSLNDLSALGLSTTSLVRATALIVNPISYVPIGNTTFSLTVTTNAFQTLTFHTTTQIIAIQTTTTALNSYPFLPFPSNSTTSTISGYSTTLTTTTAQFLSLGTSLSTSSNSLTLEGNVDLNPGNSNSFTGVSTFSFLVTFLTTATSTTVLSSYSSFVRSFTVSTTATTTAATVFAAGADLTYLWSVASRSESGSSAPAFSSSSDIFVSRGYSYSLSKTEDTIASIVSGSGSSNLSVYTPVFHVGFRSPLSCNSSDAFYTGMSFRVPTIATPFYTYYTVNSGTTTTSSSSTVGSQTESTIPYSFISSDQSKRVFVFVSYQTSISESYDKILNSTGVTFSDGATITDVQLNYNETSYYSFTGNTVIITRSGPAIFSSGGSYYTFDSRNALGNSPFTSETLSVEIFFVNSVSDSLRFTDQRTDKAFGGYAPVLSEQAFANAASGLYEVTIRDLAGNSTVTRSSLTGQDSVVDVVSPTNRIKALEPMTAFLAAQSPFADPFMTVPKYFYS